MFRGKPDHPAKLGPGERAEVQKDSDFLSAVLGVSVLLQSSHGSKDLRPFLGSQASTDS